MQPLVSIIIPVHNGEKTLRSCIQAVQAQSYRHYELIFIDNNSTDSTAKILTEFQNTDKRIVLLFERQRSRGKARSVGEKAAHGEIIVMTDADALPHDTEWLTELINPIVENKADIVQGFEQPADADNFWSLNFYHKAQERFDRIGKQNEVIGSIDTKNFAIRKRLLDASGGSSPLYKSGHDLELSIRLQALTPKIIFSSNAVVIHHNPTTLLQTFKKQFLRGYWVTKVFQHHKLTPGIQKIQKDNIQTFDTFIPFVKDLLLPPIFGPRDIRYFNFMTGLPWRLGIIAAMIL
jgi:glycosyltransferase involved in cell wall biosynthesis